MQNGNSNGTAIMFVFGPSFFYVCRRLHVLAPGNGAQILKLNRVQTVPIAC